jgi:hypothetical protein
VIHTPTLALPLKGEGTAPSLFPLPLQGEGRGGGAKHRWIT